MKKNVLPSLYLKKNVVVEVYNRLAGESAAPDLRADYNWLTVGYFAAGVHTESDVRAFVKVIRAALDSKVGKPLGRVRVIRDDRPAKSRKVITLGRSR